MSSRFNYRNNNSFDVHRAGPWKTSSSIGPKVESKPNKGMLNGNTKLTLTCWSEGGAVQSLKWYRNDKEVRVLRMLLAIASIHPNREVTARNNSLANIVCLPTRLRTP